MLRWARNLINYAFRSPSVEAELDEEVRSSFEMIVDQFVARGMPLAAARRAARIEFEGVEQVKENVRDTFAGSVFRVFFQDARYAWRGLHRRPSFAFISLLTLGLGIGVNTAVFQPAIRQEFRPCRRSEAPGAHPLPPQHGGVFCVCQGFALAVTVIKLPAA